MELPVFFQAEQAALAALLGVLLAALYDLLRALRRVLPGAAGFADGLFALVFFLSMLAFALYPGQGVFRLGFFLEIALGAAAYFLTLSRLLLQIFEGILRAHSADFAYAPAAGAVWCKKIFSFFEKPLCKMQKMGYNYR